ncbi:DUF6090 family protein [Aegicerativicinus sediminis]|uniref:DUF6090 family protein n=1 Tax=Aegicerativicinus sediminis TaxID=2893202 RepID=UPI001E3DB24E|nr:DUF6090 family protein [Aegicerativicinus sediminis]
MSKIWNKYRLDTLLKNKISKYFIYAIGEIVLVVIGILIALQINNWSSYKNDRLLEKQYLENFLRDFKNDSSSLAYFSDTYPKKIEVLLQARKYIHQGIEIKDSLAFIDNMGYGGVGSRASMVESKSTYDDMISTGNLRLLSNENLKQSILYYYQMVENTKLYLGNLRTEYATFINSFSPYDSRHSFQLEPKDVQLAFKAFKTDEFLRLTNSELTYAYAFRVRVDLLCKINSHVIKEINKEINRFEYD